MVIPLNDHFKKAYTAPKEEDFIPLYSDRPNSVVIQRSNPNNGSYRNYSVDCSIRQQSAEGRSTTTYVRTENDEFQMLVNGQGPIDHRGRGEFLEGMDSIYNKEDGFNAISDRLLHPETGRVVLYTHDGEQQHRQEFDMSKTNDQVQLLYATGLLTETDLDNLNKLKASDPNASAEQKDALTRNFLRGHLNVEKGQYEGGAARFGTQVQAPSSA